MNHTHTIAMSVITASLLAAAGALAQDAVINPAWYVQPSLNALKPDADFGVDHRGEGAGLKFGKAINTYWDVQLGTTYARSRENGQRYQQNTLGVDGLYLFSRRSFRPFLLVGLGAEHDKADLKLVGQRSKNSPYLSAGLGFQADLSERVALQADLRSVHGFLRGDDFPSSRSNNYYATLALNIAFSAPPHSAPAVPPAPPPPEPARQPVVQMPPPAPLPPPRFEKITLSATELFGFDSAALATAQPKLNDIANVLNANPDIGNVTIAGYTDRLGSTQYNLKLSERRASAVKDYLVGKGVAASRLTTVGKGEAQAVVQCHDRRRADLIVCLEPNRRVEVEQITVERRIP